jgi:protein-S-isoprenylcysteine O-methyltransferase Ste14
MLERGSVMLESNVLLVSITGAWILSAIFYYLLKTWRGNRLPSGSIKKEASDSVDPAPGTNLSRLGIIIAMTGNRLAVIAIVLLSFFKLWANVPIFLTIPFPLWLNWLGLLGIWFHYAWGIAVLYYNVNYIPAFKSMPATFVLATGGPYRIIRHPYYVGDLFFTVFLFLTTGWWLLGISALGWITLPRQASEEEKALLARFGVIFEDYTKRTGRLLPRIRKKTPV